MISSIILLGGALPNLKGLVKCALWGLRGRTPYKSCSYRVGLLSVVANVPFCEPSNWQHSLSTHEAPALYRLSGVVVPLLLAPRALRLRFISVLRLLLFLGRNMIFHQKQNGRTFPYRAVRPVAYHQVFRNFYAIHRTKKNL